jgi:hypothetical protein
MTGFMAYKKHSYIHNRCPTEKSPQKKRSFPYPSFAFFRPYFIAYGNYGRNNKDKRNVKQNKFIHSFSSHHNILLKYCIKKTQKMQPYY